MSKSKPIHPAKFGLADKQRRTALKSVFKTLDEFVIPSCDPDMADHYEKLKAYLLKCYTK